MRLHLHIALLIGCASLFSVVACRSTPDQPKPGRAVVSTTPEHKPLWYRDYAAWVEKQARARARRFVMAAGEGPNESSARRDVLYEAAAALGIASGDLPRLKLADTPYVVEYDDGSYKVTAVYEYEAPVAPKPAKEQDAAFPYREGVARLCDDLLDQIAKEKRESIATLGVASFGYKTTPFPCEFSDFLEAELRRAFQERVGSRMKVLDPALMKSDSALATPDAAVAGNYWPSDKDRVVRVQARMTDMTTGNLLGESSIDLSLGHLRVRTEPLAAEAAEKNLAAANTLRDKIRNYSTGSRNFNIAVWLDKGRRAWRKGEKLVFHFKSDRDCYLNLIHFDSAGNVQLLFPNQWHRDASIEGGRVYTIPDENMNFDLEVGEPFGTDIVLAIAATDKTSDMYTFREGADEGFRSIEGGARGIVLTPRKELADLPGDKKSEALLTLTTMP